MGTCIFISIVCNIIKELTNQTELVRTFEAKSRHLNNAKEF